MPPESRRDIDELLGALETPAPPDQAPPWPSQAPVDEAGAPARHPWWRRGWRRALVPAVVGALALLVIKTISPPHTVGPTESAPVRSDGRRGQAVQILPELDLQLAVQREGVARRSKDIDQLVIGDRVLFRIASATPTPVHLWVDGPAGVEDIIEIEIQDKPVELRIDDGLLAWELDAPGRYTFTASTMQRPACTPPACVSVVLEVP